MALGLMRALVRKAAVTRAARATMTVRAAVVHAAKAARAKKVARVRATQAARAKKSCGSSQNGCGKVKNQSPVASASSSIGVTTPV